MTLWVRRGVADFRGRPWGEACGLSVVASMLGHAEPRVTSDFWSRFHLASSDYWLISSQRQATCSRKPLKQRPVASDYWRQSLGPSNWRPSADFARPGGATNGTFLASRDWCCVGCFLGNSFFLPARGCRGTAKLSTAWRQSPLRSAERPRCCARFGMPRNTISARDR